jgi:hypothetical protein
MYDSIGPDDLTVLAPQEGVYLGMRALLVRGDTVVVTYPGASHTARCVTHG